MITSDGPRTVSGVELDAHRALKMAVCEWVMSDVGLAVQMSLTPAATDKLISRIEALSRRAVPMEWREKVLAYLDEHQPRSYQTSEGRARWTAFEEIRQIIHQLNRPALHVEAMALRWRIYDAIRDAPDTDADTLCERVIQALTLIPQAEDQEKT